MDIPKGNIKADLVYKNTKQRDLMLTFLPPYNKRYESAPVYFLIPGGGWHTEDRQSIIDFYADSVDRLRKEGFAVVGIDYRICHEGVVMREIITDCFDAVRYVAHFAENFEIDKNNFFISGHSAGAHLALMISYASQDIFKGDYPFDDVFGVKGVVAMSPPTALYDSSTNNLRDLDDVFKGYDTKEERKQTSPISYASENCPPTLLCAGTSDYLVFANSSEKLYKKLKECDAEVKLVLSVGGGHCFEKIHDNIEPNITMVELQDIIAKYILDIAEV